MEIKDNAIEIDQIECGREKSTERVNPFRLDLGGLGEMLHYATFLVAEDTGLFIFLEVLRDLFVNNEKKKNLKIHIKRKLK